MGKIYFVLFRGSRSLISVTKMARTKKTPYTKCCHDAVKPGTSREKVEGASSKEKKGKHSKWISFLNDFNMQYTNEN